MTVNGVHVGITVRWSNASGYVTVTVNGKSKTLPSGNGRATIDIGRAREANWQITANGRSYGDAVIIKRPTMVGAGVFTIKALPIGIAYEPPQDPGTLNNNRYTRVTTTATALSSSIQTSTGTTVPKGTSRRLVHPDGVGHRRCDRRDAADRRSSRSARWSARPRAT